MAPAYHVLQEHSSCRLQSPWKQSLQSAKVWIATLWASSFRVLNRRYRVVDDPTVVEIAKKLDKDPAILLISWAVQRGSAVLPKSVTPSRIESNFQGDIPWNLMTS